MNDVVKRLQDGSLPAIVVSIWGQKRAHVVAGEYKIAMGNHPLFVRDLAMFCNIAAPIQGASDFERGVEEGKRRVWLHMARMAGLNPSDFVSIADGTPSTTPFAQED